MKIGVIAGTPVDTQMGMEYIKSKGHEAIGFACSSNPQEQTKMQVLYKGALTALVIDGCRKMTADGAEGIFVYCNSLSAAVDMQYIKTQLSVPLVTPLDIYRQCAAEYSSLAVIAANGQSLAGIEKVILEANPQCSVYGAGMLPIVESIEKKLPPQEIYDTMQLKKLTDCFCAVGCRAVILGCTHFPYLEEQVKANLSVKLINPSDSMLSILTGSR